MTNIYVKPEEKVVTNGTAQAPIPQVPIPKITYAQGGVPTVSGQPTNYGNLMGGGTSVPPSSTPSTTYAANGYGTDMSQATIPEYYKYAYDVGMQNAEATRYNAVQNARAQYNQFINPYGAVANQQAQAGFTGGGYSQFLQGQAYQSMIDSQNMARAKEAEAKQTLYGDYLKGMAEYNQAEKNKQEQNAVAAADLLNNIGNYTSLEAVNSALDVLGITDDAQRKTYTDAWTNQNQQNTAKNEIAFNEEIQGVTDEEEIKNIGTALGVDQNTVESTISTNYQNSYKEDLDVDGWESFFNNERYKNLTAEQKAEANKKYEDFLYNALGVTETKTGLGSLGKEVTNGYFLTANGGEPTKESVSKTLSEAVADKHMPQKIKDAIINEAYYKYGVKPEDKQRNEIISNARNINNNVEIKDDANVVNINSSTYASSDFGKFNDTGKKDSGQETYLKKAVDLAMTKDANGNEVNVGKIIIVNYGKNSGKVDAYMYAGNGQFIQVDWSGNLKPLRPTLLFQMDITKIAVKLRQNKGEAQWHTQ